MLVGIESKHSEKRFTLRTATADDLDDLTAIHRDGFSEEPQVHYCFPSRDEYPEHYWNWTKREYDGYLKQPEKYVVHIIEMSSKVGGKVVKKPAGLAVWNVAVLAEATDAGMIIPSQVSI